MKYKKLLLLLLYILVPFLQSGIKAQTDIEYVGLKGPVKSHITNQYQVKKRNKAWEIDTANYTQEVMLYNDHGEYIESRSYIAGKLSAQVIPERENGKFICLNTYDESGKLVLKSMVTYHGDTIISETKDMEGKLIERAMTIATNGKLTSLKVFFYDKSILLDNSWPIPDNSPIYVSEYSFNKGLLISEKLDADASGIFPHKKTAKHVKFDSKGNWTKQLIFDSKDKINPIKVNERVYTYYPE